MSQLLFEIGVEELPSLSIDPALEFMKDFMAEALLDHRLEFSHIEAEGTPRRLVLFIDGLPKKQSAITEEILGPKVEQAFLPNGELSPIGLGFLKAKNIDPKKAFRKNTSKGEVLAIELYYEGEPAQAILPKILKEMMQKIPFKKRMRWERSGDTFLRPVRWLLVLFDKEYLPLSFADVISDKYSYGHRLMAPDAFKVTSIKQYREEMIKRWVMLSSTERKDVFLKEAEEKAEGIKGHICRDEELLAIVKNLVEYPFLVMGEYERKYLEIPKEILISEMKAHQKCFAIDDGKGNLLPYFIASAAIKPYDEKVFAKGNAKVIRARFEDGAYYFYEDQKKTLKEHAKSLSGLVFERELGSMKEKSLRIENIALSIASDLLFSKKEEELLALAAPLLKADLVTGVVQEFPELEGIMGSIYAKKDGLDDLVCEAIKTHYFPKSSEGPLPKSKIAAVLSIADKLDTIVGIIGISKMPSGNKDPYALRRASLGIIRILLKFKFSLSLKKMIDIAISAYGEKFLAKKDNIKHNVENFIIQRARGLLIDTLAKEGGERATTLVDAVIASGFDDLVDVFLRAHALFDFRKEDSDEFDKLLSTYKRASNIVKKAEKERFFVEGFHFDCNILQHEAEKVLYKALKTTKSNIEKNDKASTDFYKKIFLEINSLRPKLDDFFDQVMVMVEDEKLKTARLFLLKNLRDLSLKVADLSMV